MQLDRGKQRSVRPKRDLPTDVHVDEALEMTTDKPKVQLAAGGQGGSPRRDGGTFDQLGPARGVQFVRGVIPIAHHQEVGVALQLGSEGSKNLGIGRVLQARPAQQVQGVHSKSYKPGS